ncbi:MAG: oligopeptide transporter, OPT family [Candidatus Marinimicrobia bacterium]|nr:oligopeptide transporter, OPT family [Candidatus Neomarinimicrobiota bacterium]MCF7828452.1 oligopeptide transporter, OPT family [Candidatus Neomarinimicrobiota bacterium]MCF7880954.1 oligopeptide transporter, OPT family [Candidatus Neomarinimicrobiota bacterium]
MEKKGLPPNAYKINEGEEYVPYVHGKRLPEFTLKAAISGILLGILFGAANTYLGLKAGLTISTSIPVAVLTVVAFRFLKVFGTDHSILEANMSQTIGSASSSVASGVLFTIPALFLWNLKPSLAQLTLLAMVGGVLGILSMIPLRRYLIKREHGNLPYPEGMACAEVLVASESGGKQASGVFWGLGFGMLVKWITDGLKLVGGKFETLLGFKAKLSIGVSPALMGVGYILGVRIASVMVAGAALSAFVIIPVINWWGSGLTVPFYPETEMLIRNMSAAEIWNRYVRYIGAGAVATGGFITLIKSIPTMIESFKLGVAQIGKKLEDEEQARIDKDLSIKVIGAIVAIVLLVLTFVPGILGYLDSIIVRGISALLIAVFAFFFVTVSSRIVGMVGVTSNPTSGMTIATLLGTSFIFYLMGWTDLAGKATALMVGTGVCIAASIAGDASQDLKTGFVLGATPARQQIGELIGVVTSAGFVCLTIILLDQSFGVGSAELPAPQGVLMQLVIDGVLEQNLPWTLIFIGVGIALVAYALKLPVLAFAVGVYLPLSTMAPVFLGGFLRYLLTRNQPEEEAERRREQGVLFGSGLVGGEGLLGVGLAAWVAAKGGERIQGLGLEYSPVLGTVISAAAIGLILYVMSRVILKKG